MQRAVKVVRMSVYALLAGAIISAVGVITEGTAASITGIRSTQEEDPAAQSTLRAASATIGIGTILLIISLVLLFLYSARSKSGKPAKGLGITALVIGILGVVLMTIGALISGIKSTQYEDEAVAAALRSAAVLVAVGILLIAIGYVIIYIVVGRRAKKFSKAT